MGRALIIGAQHNRLGGIAGKALKRFINRIHVAIKIKMIRGHIGNHYHGRVITQEGPIRFICLDDEYLVASPSGRHSPFADHASIDSANIAPVPIQGASQHRCRGCFPVGTSNCKNLFALHNPPQGLRAVQHDKPVCSSMHEFWIVIPDRTRDHHGVCPLEVGSIMTDKDRDTSLPKRVSHLGIRSIGSAHLQSFFFEYTSYPAHS